MTLRRDFAVSIELMRSIKMSIGVKLIAVVIGYFVAFGVIILIVNNINFISGYDWIPVILFIQTIIIILQVRTNRTLTRYSKIPYLPEFHVDSNPIHHVEEAPVYQIKLINVGEIAHRVEYMILLGTKQKKIKEGNFGIFKKDKSKEIHVFKDGEEFIDNIVRVKLLYYDRVGNPIFSGWFKLKNEESFQASLSGLDQ